MKLCSIASGSSGNCIFAGSETTSLLIDAGISGRTAQMVSEKLRVIARSHQVICITHLPQIAARGRAHYKVYKKDSDTETNSHIRRLTDEERVEEIAHMLSGATLTEAALSNAKSLLARN